MSAPSAESVRVAGAVLAKARLLDPNITATPETITAWAEVFEGRAWPTEAAAAVVEHYAKPWPRRLTPGDVVAYCQAQPPSSSREHAAAFIDRWSEYPFARVIESATGIDFPLEVYTTSVTEPARAAEVRSQWLADNREQLIDALMARGGR
mgnify:CR=1 FL=1